MTELQKGIFVRFDENTIILTLDPEQLPSRETLEALLDHLAEAGHSREKHCPEEHSRKEYCAAPEPLPAKNLLGYLEKFRTVCEYIDDHCAEDLTLDQMASLAGFSKYHFTRLFHQFTGESFYQYLSSRRIAIAQELLLDPEYTVTGVALRSGFSSLSAFLRMFRLQTGCTPTEYRRTHMLKTIV